MNAPRRNFSVRLAAGMAAFAAMFAGFVLVAPPAQAATISVTVDGITFEANNSAPGQGATVTAYDGSAGTSVTIPDSADFSGTEYAVKKIGTAAFQSSSLTSVSIPNGITAIGSNAFAGNSLTTVALPNTVTSIGTMAFYGNVLTSATLPNALTTIPDLAFYNNNLTSITIPNTVTSIGVDAFNENEIGSIALPSGITTIGDRAFYTNMLTTVTVPGSVTTLGKYAFAQNDLTSATIQNGLTSIGEGAFEQNDITSITIPGSVTAIGKFAFHLNKLPSLTLPEGVQTLGESAFQSNLLTSVTLPTTVTTIDKVAFRYNAGLVTVRFHGNAPTVQPADPGAAVNESFPHANAGLSLHYLNGKTGFATPTWQGYTTVKELTISDTKANGVTYVADPANVAAGATATACTACGPSVAIPTSVVLGGTSYAVKKIGNNAFTSKSLTSVSLPSGLTSIGQSAFQDNSLTGVTIPNTVTTIGPTSFAGNDLTSIVIPNSVTTIGANVFAVNNIATATISSSLTAIPESMFESNALTSITIPSGITSIGTYAFLGNSLETVTIPSGVTTIGLRAFDHNTGLTSVSFLGNAPTVTPVGANESFDVASGSLVLHWLAGKTGFTAPSWLGYTTKPHLVGTVAIPTITGTLRETKGLTVNPGVVPPAATVMYQWKADGKNVGAPRTSNQVTLSKSFVGHRVSVQVTASFPGADSLTATSAASTKVVSSPYKRLVLSPTSVKKGKGFKVAATSLKRYQKVKIILNGVTRYSGRADADGTVYRAVTFKSNTKTGARIVKVIGIKSKGKPAYAAATKVRYYK